MPTFTPAQLEALPWQEPEHPSGQIHRIAWIDNTSALALGLAEANFSVVQFRTKPDKPASVYLYRDCPQPVVTNVLQAESPGKMLNLAIKGVYDFERVLVEEPA